MRRLMEVAPYLSGDDAELLDRWWRLSPDAEAAAAERVGPGASPRFLASMLSASYYTVAKGRGCSYDEASAEWGRLLALLPEKWVDPEEWLMGRV